MSRSARLFDTTFLKRPMLLSARSRLPHYGHYSLGLEKYVFTRPTMVSLPLGLPHCPLEITRVDRPIIQLEIMLSGEGGTREPYFEKDKCFNPMNVMDFERL